MVFWLSRRRIRMVRKTLHLFTALVAGLSEKAAQRALLNLQKSLDYCIEKNRVLREQLRDKHGSKRLILTNSQRRRLAVKGIAVGRHVLSQISVLFQPATILG